MATRVMDADQWLWVGMRMGGEVGVRWGGGGLRQAGVVYGSRAGDTH